MGDDPHDSANAPKNLMMRCMGLMGRLMPANEGGENPRAVRLFHRVNQARDILSARWIRRSAGRLRGRSAWPVTSGAYVIGDPGAPVAVCCLTSEELAKPAAGLRGVAIAGRLHVPNLGIEKIVRNTVSNPHIRFLVLCGEESKNFAPGQALASLFSAGVDGDRRIRGATGPMPVLRNLTDAAIGRFRDQVELIDRAGERDLRVLESCVAECVARDPGPFDGAGGDVAGAGVGRPGDGGFKRLPVSGRRAPLVEDAKGFFIVSIDEQAGEILLHHYYPDHARGHEIRGKSGGAMLRTAVGQGLISDLGHAGYLGAELAKAEAALKLGLAYEQDRLLRRK